MIPISTKSLFPDEYYNDDIFINLEVNKTFPPYMKAKPIP